MSRQIAGTRFDQIFSFQPKLFIKVLRNFELKKLGKKKKTTYFVNNLRGKAWLVEKS